MEKIRRTVVTDARTPNKTESVPQRKRLRQIHSRAQEDPEGSQRWSLFLLHITILPTPSPGNLVFNSLKREKRRRKPERLDILLKETEQLSNMTIFITASDQVFR